MDTEEQQVEALKKWWKENGSSIITGVVLGLAVLFGYKYWMAQQEALAKQASGIYTVMLNEIDQGENEAAGNRAGVLLADYSATPYASLAAMLLAKLRIEEDDLESAKTQLQWVLDNSSSGVIQDTARLRMARVLLGLQDYDKAMEQLDQLLATSGQDGLLSEIRGDIYTARGETRQAVDAYQSALAQLGTGNPAHRMVQLKYDYAVSLAAPAAEEES